MAFIGCVMVLSFNAQVRAWPLCYDGACRDEEEIGGRLDIVGDVGRVGSNMLITINIKTNVSGSRFHFEFYYDTTKLHFTGNYYSAVRRGILLKISTVSETSPGTIVIKGGGDPYAGPLMKLEFEVISCGKSTGSLQSMIVPTYWTTSGGCFDSWDVCDMCTLPPNPNQNPDDPIWGFADTHVHMFANLGYGGQFFWGSPYADYIWDALPLCTPVHGKYGLGDILGHFIAERIGHDVAGFRSQQPDNQWRDNFTGWPRWDTIDHQQVYYEWLYRAYQGGLRLMVLLPVNNQTFACAANRRPDMDMDKDTDMAAVYRQIEAAKALEAFIDNKCGGPGRGWFRIVRSGREARRVINEGKLAIVLGTEVPSLFDCHKNDSGCNEDRVTNGLNELYDAGVRHVFPVHNTDNAFGGTAIYTPLFVFNNKYITGDWWCVKQCDDPSRDFHLDYLPSYISKLLSIISPCVGGVPPDPPPGSNCNCRELQPIGEFFINKLMDKGMIIDVNHMSELTFKDVLSIAEGRKYPAICAGHSGFVEIGKWLGNEDSKRHEGNITSGQIESIRNLGGLISPIIDQGSTKQLEQYVRPDGTYVAFDCGHSSKAWLQAYLYAVDNMQGGAVGIGSDLNGFVKMPAPRWKGSDATCTPWPTEACDDDKIAEQGNEVVYPFTSFFTDQVRFGKSSVDGRVFDYNYDGFAHVGLYPDFIQDLSNILNANGIGDVQALTPLFRSAEAYVSMWEKAEFKAEFRDRSLVKGDNKDDVYWFQNGKLYRVISKEAFDGMGPLWSWDAIVVFSQRIFDSEILNVYPEGPHFITANSNSNGLLIRAVGDHQVWLIQGGQRHYVVSPYEFGLCGFSFADVIDVTPAIRDLIPAGDPVIDSDGDGYFKSSSTSGCSSCHFFAPECGALSDCNDNNPNIHPGATEQCNGVDDDCDGVIDVNIAYYRDADGDEYGNPNNSILACTQPSGYVSNNQDCDDADANVNPGVAEVCSDGKDNDCNPFTFDEQTYFLYSDADGDGYGAGETIRIIACRLPVPGYASNDDDCNDSNANIHPGATELCNNLDDNCNGQIDEGVRNTYYRDADGDGYGNPNNSTQACTQPTGYVSNHQDCDDADANVNPGMAEVCSDGKDNDCNRLTFDEQTYFLYSDADGDGYGAGETIRIIACQLPVPGYVSNNQDCDDADANVNPGMAEVCRDGKDNDCNRLTFDERTYFLYSDADGDGYGAGETIRIIACRLPVPGYASNDDDCNDSNANIHPGATELCNGVDDDCDGQIDEGLNCSTPKICRTCPLAFSVKQGRTKCKPFKVWNCGKGTLSWTVSEGCYWLTLTPSNGTSTKEKDKIKACVDTTGMAKGDYECTVTITGDGASNTPQTCVIKLRVK